MASFGVRGSRVVTIVMVAGALTAGVAGGADAAKPAVVTVCASGCGYSTIQDAVDHAPNGAVIQVGAGTYDGFSVTTAARRLTVQGAGIGQTTLDGHSDDGGFHVSAVTVGARVNLAMSGLTVTHGANDYGDGNGGGIENGGTLTLTNVAVTDSRAAGEGGGTVYNSGTLTATNVTLSGGSALNGAGLLNGAGASASIINSTISGNFADNGGGGIRNDKGGTVNLTGTTITGNATSHMGHGILNDGTMTITSSTVNGNGAIGDLGSSGGGIFNTGTLTLSSTSVSNNLTGNASIPSTAVGGGIYNSGTTTLRSSSVTGNSATGSGGGVYNDGGSVKLKTSTIASNTPDNCAPAGSVPGCTA